ncbi:MAG: cell division protein FtsX [Candidatus Muproteobacteria bacterium RBG_19FT_COMBO_61_10]|uniref:Cell division protein FtsX n=1 Tax=Candidatus Muproteobacteria bacterium RBG_19FT_COMBO_61_10 TaxID=1817761 RepID=A0A1F6UIW1_9PROT|nr:MAG: cell division protein FtsX [Candidatus Muproteobacteria bacterium RBG_19FT_COMBO_61_10]
MIRPYELFVGLRYTRAKRRNHFISFISLTSMFGTALGVMALITVLSVMNGFEKELRTRILGVASHLTITGDTGRLRDWRAVEKVVAADADVLGSAPYVQGQGMLTRGKVASGILVRGILPEAEPRVADIGDKMIAGKLSDLRATEFGIILGRDLAWKLGVDLGSRLALVVPEGQITAAGLLPRMKRFTVVGIFEIGMYEYDSGLALVNIEDAALLYQMPGQVSGLRLKLADVYRAPRAADRLEDRLGAGYRARDWTREHANYFRALKMEKTVMFIILLLIVAVAAFNIVSTLVMVVTDKEAEIAILRTLGATPRSIMAIFMVQGTVIGVVGTLLGAVLGILLAHNVDVVVPFLERLFSTTFLAKDVYYISELPSDMRWPDVVTITSASLLMGFLATLYPARRASLTQPAEALRYE